MVFKAAVLLLPLSNDSEKNGGVCGGGSGGSNGSDGDGVWYHYQAIIFTIMVVMMIVMTMVMMSCLETITPHLIIKADTV